MSNPQEHLAQLRREIDALRRQIATLAPGDPRRETLYLALLRRYHESFMLYNRLLDERSR